MAKVKSDPLAPVRDKVQKLTIHLEKTKSLLSSGSTPARHKNRAEAYREWLKLEATRTARKLEDLKLLLPAGK